MNRNSFPVLSGDSVRGKLSSLVSTAALKRLIIQLSTDVGSCNEQQPLFRFPLLRTWISILGYCWLSACVFLHDRMGPVALDLFVTYRNQCLQLRCPSVSGLFLIREPLGPLASFLSNESTRLVTDMTMGTQFVRKQKELQFDKFATLVKKLVMKHLSVSSTKNCCSQDA